MKKTLLTLAVIAIAQFSYAQWTTSSGNTSTSDKVGIGTSGPSSHLEIFELSGSKPDNVPAPTASILKLSRAGTSGYAYNESAEFRVGHGGPSAWGSQLDLFLNGASNQSNIPDQQVMTWLYNGNVGVGTTNPSAAFDVGRLLSMGELGTVLARLPEGNTTGSGTYLGVKGYATQINESFPTLNDVKSFSIEHSFYGSTNSSINFLRGAGSVGGAISFGTYDNTEKMRILGNGNVGIGTTTPDQKLAVNGTIHSKEVKVDMDILPDYVFKPTYKLTSLKDIKTYIDQNHHLPGVPSAQQVEKNGLNLGEMNAILLKKVEELTLYLIEKDKQVVDLNKQVEEQNQQMKAQQKVNESLQEQINKLAEKQKELD